MRTRTHRVASLPFVLPLVLVLAGAISACGDVSAIEAEATRELLSGDWEATDVTITNIANPQQVVDLLEAGGALEFRFNLAGDATIFVTSPDGETVADEGTYEFDDSFIYFIDNETEEVTALAYDLQVTQVANSLTLATTDFEWVFPGSDDPRPALFAIILIR